MIEKENILDFTQTVWTTVLGTEVEPGGAPSQAPTMQGIVRISGSWEGEIAIECSPAFARWAAATMFDASDTSQDDVRDALGELANMVGGNIKALLPGPSHLSPPRVQAGQGGEADEAVTVLRFTCRGEPIAVKVRERPGTEMERGA
ncbi:MAG: chemotaxis protein CheX [Myxococcales bacterium]|nr:chemotaxis protein CheX [Myxococcales bacterium]